jgi:two-component system phosphate regulon response regulator PhoB
MNTSSQSPKEILVVDDNEDMCFLIEKILTYFGFKTKIVQNGQSALDYCETEQPALILLDLSLPDIHGLEIAKRLRSKDQYANIPIIALTARPLETFELTAQEIGFNDFLIKPFFSSDLMKIIHKHFK